MNSPSTSEDIYNKIVYFLYINNQSGGITINRKNLVSNSCLLISALIWGLAFVAQSLCTDYIGPFTYNAIRSYIGTLVLIPLIILLKKSEKKKAFENGIDYKGVNNIKKLVFGGVCCGLLLFAASVLQQFGISQTSVGKAGFITTLYVVLVPVFGIFLKKRTPLLIWFSVAIAVAGLYLLSVKSGFSVDRGDSVVFMSAVVFAVHILVIDYFSPLVDSIIMSCIQFFASAIISTVCMFIFETPTIQNIMSCILPLLYLGVFSTGIAYTLQVVMQKNTNPTVASLILSFESVFAALGGWFILHQSLSTKELTGCILMFTAIVFAQLPDKTFSLILKRKIKEKVI